MHRSSVDAQARATGSCSFVAIHCGSAAVAWRLAAMEELYFTNEFAVSYRADADRPNYSHSPRPPALLASPEEGWIQSRKGPTRVF
jgi:hypothetical protein